ncbi:MAG: CHAP domain-containing protein [Mogibacterium sp.]|nr:CHAP domain-containing protein [Mogibacterium sp.]
MTPEKMEKKQRAKIVNTARYYLGAKQGSAKHHRIINIFNTVKPDGWAMTYTAFWCAASVSAWAIETFGKDKAKEFFPLSANCGTIICNAKKLGIWKESDAYKPEAGDWILYDWDDKTGSKADCKGGPDHVGLVEYVKDNVITVIEGNYHKAVTERKIAVNGNYIRGYVLPKYDKIVKHSKRWYFRKTTAEIFKYMRAHDFKYEGSYTKNSLTWAGAKKKKTANCSLAVCYALQECGLFEPGMYFWINGDNIVYRGKKGTKTRLEKIATIKHPHKSPAKAGLKKGDICGYKDNAHMMEFAGFDAKGRPTWYSFGSSDVGDKMPKVKKSYNDKMICTLIRVKK